MGFSRCTPSVLMNSVGISSSSLLRLAAAFRCPFLPGREVESRFRLLPCLHCESLRDRLVFLLAPSSFLPRSPILPGSSRHGRPSNVTTRETGKPATVGLTGAAVFRSLRHPLHSLRFKQQLFCCHMHQRECSSFQGGRIGFMFPFCFLLSCCLLLLLPARFCRIQLSVVKSIGVIDAPADHVCHLVLDYGPSRTR